MNSNKSLCLKVLKGVNEGAIANISSELLSVGSSNDCDIILSGFTAIEKRLEFNFEAGNTSIKVINQPLYIDGIKVNPTIGFIPLDLYQLISFGGCCISIGERNEDWPSSITNKQYQDPRNQQKNIYARIRDYIRFTNFQQISDSKKIVIVFLVFGIATSIFLANTSAPNQKNTPKASLKIIKEKDEGSTKNINIIEKTAYGLLQTFGVNRINLHFKGDGTLVAKGYVGSSEKWEKAKTSILEDIDLVARIDSSQIETFRERVLELNEMLRAKKIKRNLSVKMDEEHSLILVSGELTNEAIQTWGVIKKAFTENYTGETEIKSSITDIEKNLKLFIRSVSIGKVHFFTSRAGKRYMVGSDLGKGFKVIAIEIDKITLSYKGNNFNVFYSRRADNESNII